MGFKRVFSLQQSLLVIYILWKNHECLCLNQRIHCTMSRGYFWYKTDLELYHKGELQCYLNRL